MHCAFVSTTLTDIKVYDICLYHFVVVSKRIASINNYTIDLLYYLFPLNFYISISALPIKDSANILLIIQMSAI